jgi:Protein of unknown function (DUF998)
MACYVSEVNRTFSATIAVTGIAIMIAAMVLGPVLSPPQFSWLQHTTSEQAGQLMPGAWAMRLGFAAYGFATICAAVLGGRNRPLVSLALAVFGLGLIGAAIWSNAPILPDLPVDIDEDWLHSIASGVVGTAFAAACAFRLFAHGGSRRDALAWIGLAVSVTIPLAMGAFPEFRGLLQRAMFGLSYLFVAREFGVFRNS